MPCEGSQKNRNLSSAKHRVTMASITRSIRASSILLRASGVRALARAVQPAVSASIHSSSAASQTTTRKLGFAAAAGVGAAAATALALSFSTAIAADAQPALTKEKGWVPFEVSEVEHISHNTAIVRFALPENHKNLGITVAGLIMARIQTGEKDGKPEYAVRPYTPVSGGLDWTRRFVQQSLNGPPVCFLSIQQRTDTDTLIWWSRDTLPACLASTLSTSSRATNSSFRAP